MSVDDDYAEDLRDWHAEDNPDGAELLDDVLAALTRYVVFPDRHAAHAVTLWVATSHALPAFDVAPRLVINSPEKRCGKTRLLDVIEGTCCNPLATSDATVAAIFRSIPKYDETTGKTVGDERIPTLIIDEADAIFGSKTVAEQHEDLRKLLNAGFQRGKPALRCVGPQQTPTKFPTFAMAALAGIGQMPDTITDRAVNVTLRRRKPEEKVSQFRRRRDGQVLRGLRDRLSDWFWSGHMGEVDQLNAERPMPVEDRAADTWEPLVAIADAAGGRWPELAREACAVLVARAEGDDEDRSLGVKLLGDVRQIFADKKLSFLSSAELVAELRKVDESPWAEFDYNASKLAYRLKEYGIKPGRDTTGKVRGYSLESLTDVFSRYLRQNPSDPSETSDDQQQSSDTLFASDGSTRQSDTLTRQTESTRQTAIAGQSTFLTPLTGSDGGTAKTAPTNGDAPAPPGGLTADTPGQTERVARALANAKAATAEPDGMCQQCRANPANTLTGLCDWCA